MTGFIHHIIFIGIFLLVFNVVYSQELIVSDTTRNGQFASDTLKSPIQDSLKVKFHSPKRAALYSAVIPGAGQIYNRKYWKAPLVWAGLAGLGYMSQTYHKDYLMFKEAYIHAATGDESDPPYPELADYKESVLENYMNSNRRNRDLMYIIGALWYVINILDATVDGHLYNWEVDEDLSVQLYPEIIPAFAGKKSFSGITLSLKF